jgi:hypothetical protein
MGTVAERTGEGAVAVPINRRCTVSRLWPGPGRTGEEKERVTPPGIVDIAAIESRPERCRVVGVSRLRRGAALIVRYKELPPASERVLVMQSWDTANKGGPQNDWSVCTTWVVARKMRWYLVDVWRGRVDYLNQHGSGTGILHQNAPCIPLLCVAFNH